jgi:hypothetical protein
MGAMHGHTWVKFVGFSVILSAAIYGCDAGGGGSNKTSGSGNGSSQGGDGQGGDLFGGMGQGGVQLGNGVVISPLDPIIQVEYGTPGPTVQFTATDIDGNTINPAWQINTSAAGTIAPSGLYSANGLAGGPVEVTARLEEESATTTLTIELHALENPGNISAGDQAILQAPGGLTATNWTLVYPYNETIFPRGIIPPEVHLNNTGQATAYYLHLTMPGCEYEGFFTPLPQIAMTQGAWDAIGSCSNGADIDVEIAKLEGGQKYVMNQTWRIAQGKMKGVVYYNTYDSPLAGQNGATMRIDGTSSTPVVWSGNCTVCHSVSADGSTGAAANHSGPGGIFDFTTNMPNPPLVYTTAELAAFAGLYPDGSVFVVQGAPGGSWPPNTPGTGGPWASELRDKFGNIIGASGIEGIYAQTPAFAHDGTKLAFCNRPIGGGPSQLKIFDYDPVMHKFTNQQVLATPPGGRHYSWPTFTPDSGFVIFQDGVGDDLATWGSNTGKIYMVNTATQVVTPLTTLNGDGYMPQGARDENVNYEPTMLPASSGGYYWVMFTSRRTYGNRLTGGVYETKRLWVAAIDANPMDGVDPSHPAFYVGGQELNSGNSRGFWVLDQCKPTNEPCVDASDCCEGTCNNGICGEADGECKHQEDTCGDDGECCAGLVCIGVEGMKRCDVVPPT